MHLHGAPFYTQNMKFICFFLSFFFSSLAVAHQPDISSTMLADKGDGTWVLQIRAALTAFEYEVKYSNQDNAYESPEEFKALIAKLVENKMALSINNVPVQFDNAIVKLGHETSVLYTIAALDKPVSKIDITQKTFENISKNRSAFVIMKKGADPQQFILDKSNEHAITLNFEGDKFVSTQGTEVTENNKYYWKYAVGFLLLVFIIFFAVYKRMKS